MAQSYPAPVSTPCFRFGKLVEKLRQMNELTKLSREKERVKHSRIVEDLDKRVRRQCLTMPMDAGAVLVSPGGGAS
jgi:hypothetical protein